MTEPQRLAKNYGAMSRKELLMDLEQYDFVTPTGEPLAPFLDCLMKKELAPRPLRVSARTSRPEL